MFEWYEVAALIIALASLALAKRSYDLRALNHAKTLAVRLESEKKDLESRLAQFELRLHHLDAPNTGRVHKLSNLVEQINNDSKKLWAVSYSARTLASRPQFRR